LDPSLEGKELKKLLLSLAVVPFLIAGCGSSDSGTDGAAAGSPPAAKEAAPGNPKDQVVGSWKVDMSKSNLGGLTDKEKAEGETVGADVKADGTYVSHGPSGDKSGTWTMDGKKITFSEKSGDIPPTMDLSDDGTQLTFSMSEGGKSVSIVMVKA
jgi:hypothetical protein